MKKLFQSAKENANTLKSIIFLNYVINLKSDFHYRIKKIVKGSQDSYIWKNRKKGHFQH